MSQILLYNSGEVVGAFFLEANQKQWAETCPAGTPVHLEAEPTNEYDPHAVRVYAQNIPIGYIPKDVSPMISLFLQGGYQITGQVDGRINKRSRGNQPKNPAITLYGAAP